MVRIQKGQFGSSNEAISKGFGLLYDISSLCDFDNEIFGDL